MLLIDNDNEIHTATVRLGNAVIQIFTFTVFDGGIAFFRNKLPVDESGAFCREAVPKRIKQILRGPMRSDLHHLLTALFFQITLAGAEPDDRRV